MLTEYECDFIKIDQFTANIFSSLFLKLE
jgi:hypothetical protein